MHRRPPRHPGPDDDFRWWQGWDPADVWRVAIFAVPGAIISLYVIGKVIDTLTGS